MTLSNSVLGKLVVDPPTAAMLARRSVSKEREILRVAATLGNYDAAAGARRAIAEVLNWAARQVGELPAVAWEQKPFEQLAGGRTCIAVVLETINSLWAMRMDRPDRDVAQRTWTVEIVVGYRPTDQHALFSLRLLVNTPESTLRIEPSVPGLVRQVATACGLNYGPSLFEVRPWTLESRQHAEMLCDFILDPARRHPIFACSVPERADEPLLDAQLLSKHTLGIARVVVVPATYSWVLTEAFGKSRSVFAGAVRAYLPGFSSDANPFVHRLYLADQVADQVGAKRASLSLRWLAANESLRRLRLGGDVLAFSTVRDAALTAERRRLQSEGAASEMELAVAQQQIESLREALSGAVDEKDLYFHEWTASDAEARQFEQQCRGLRARIQVLIAQIKQRGERPDDGSKLPEHWEEFAEWCDETLAARVILSPRARREVKSPEYDSPGHAAQCLLWLANEYWEARLDGAGDDLQGAILEGVHNARCGADSLELDFDGRRLRADWHIKSGGNTRDPRRCLRIYYAWDQQSQQIVIASMPGHISTDAS